MKKMKFGVKLILLVSLSLLIVIVTNVYSLIALRAQTNHLKTTLYNNTYQTSQLLIDADRDMYRARLAAQNAVSVTDPTAIEQNQQDFKDNISQAKGEGKQAEAILKKNQKLYSQYTNNKVKTNVKENFAQFNKQLDLWEKEAQPYVNQASINIQVDQRTRNINMMMLYDSNFNGSRNDLSNIEDLIASNAMIQIKQVNQKVKSDMIVQTIIIFISFFLILFFGVILIREIQRSLRKLASMSTEVAEGNLAVEDLHHEAQDEIGLLANAMNKMKHQLTEIIQQIAHTSENMLNSSQELATSSYEVKESNTQVATTMTELASGAEQQASLTTNIAEGMETFSAFMVKSNQNGEYVRQSSKEAIELTQKGYQSMMISQSHMEDIHKTVEDSLKSVKGLDQKTQEISNLVKLIRDIAEQTNLLALNAAIEAARAGEQGRGFAVVAQEVRKLAEQVSDSVNGITNLVGGIQTESGQVVETLQSGFDKVTEGSHQIKETSDTFEAIKGSMTTLEEKLLTMSDMLQQATDGSAKINGSLENIAAVVEESSAGIEETAASVQETTSMMETVAYSSKTIAGLADELNTMVHRFKIKKLEEENVVEMEAVVEESSDELSEKDHDL